MPRFARCIPIVSLVLILSLAFMLSEPAAAVPGRSAQETAHPAPDWDKEGALAPDSADPASGLEDGMAPPSVESGGRLSPAAVVKKMRPLLDIRALRRSLDDIGLLKAAGFAYQEGLTLPGDICPQPGDRDQAAVLSGMAASDQAYALFFGKAEDAARENRLLRKLSPKTHLPGLTAKEKNVLAKDPTGPAGREIIVRRSCGPCWRPPRKTRPICACWARISTASFWSVCIPRPLWCWPPLKATPWNRSTRCVRR